MSEFLLTPEIFVEAPKTNCNQKHLWLINYDNHNLKSLNLYSSKQLISESYLSFNRLPDRHSLRLGDFQFSTGDIKSNFWRNFLEHERKIFEHSWTNHELRVIQLEINC